MADSMADEAQDDGTPIPGSDVPARQSSDPPAGAPPAGDPWWGPAGRLARWLLGAFSLVGGLTWFLLNVHGPSAAVDTLIGFVLAAGGLVLLMPHRIELPRGLTALAMTVVGVAGTAAGLLSVRTKECCMFAYVVDRGWPFTWLQRGGVADDPDTARRLAGSAGWTADVISLTADLVLWAYAGMLLVVIVVLVRRARGGSGRPRA